MTDAAQAPATAAGQAKVRIYESRREAYEAGRRNGAAAERAAIREVIDRRQYVNPKGHEDVWNQAMRSVRSFLDAREPSPSEPVAER